MSVPRHTIFAATAPPEAEWTRFAHPTKVRPETLPRSKRPVAAGPSRLEQIGRQTAGVAHDFNNLLSVILVCADEIADAAGNQTQRVRAKEIRAAAERGATLSRRLLSDERGDAPASERIAIDVAIIDGLGLLKRALGSEVELSLTSDGHLPPVRLVPGELERILINLATNSRDAMPEGGSLAIRTSLVPVAPGDPSMCAGWFVRIALSDTGTGMTPEVARRAIEPHFSTKDSGAGSGLGLATVHDLTRAAGGDLRINTTPGSGTTVSVYLPAAGVEHIALAPAPAA